MLEETDGTTQDGCQRARQETLSRCRQNICMSHNIGVSRGCFLIDV